MNEVWLWGKQVAIIIATLAAGGPGAVWFVDKVKAQFDIHGNWAFALAAAVSVVVAVAGLIASDKLNLTTVGPENLSEIALAIFFASQAYYRMMQQKRVGKAAEG